MDTTFPPPGRIGLVHVTMWHVRARQVEPIRGRWTDLHGAVDFRGRGAATRPAAPVAGPAGRRTHRERAEVARLPQPGRRRPPARSRRPGAGPGPASPRASTGR